MREILYVQAGSFANYTGTHFWNSQETYFTYDDLTEALVCHDYSFREGIDDHGNQTYCPRLLIFDMRSNFGSLSSANALYGCEVYGDNSGGTESPRTIWGGEVVACTQEPISATHPTNRMNYHDAAGNRDSSGVHIDNEAQIDHGGHEELEPEIRFWSDFARVSYTPRTIQKIPESPDWEKGYGDWNIGRETFMNYNKETGLMEGAVRLSLEECDSPQGVQIMEDTLTFGSFINSFITSFRDEFAKLPILAFPLLSDSVPTTSKMDGPRDLKFLVNDALALRGFNDIQSASCIPIQSPVYWCNQTPGVRDDWRTNPYSSSAILCSHLETSTLPLRLKSASSTLTLSSLLAQLNWRGTNRFSHLSGGLFLNSSERFDGSLAVSDFSLPAKLKPDTATLFACSDVSRGFSEEDLLVYDKWRLQAATSYPFVTSVHAPGYSCGEAFCSPPTTSLKSSPRHAISGDNIRILSRMATTSATAQTLGAYARVIQDEVTHRPSVTVQRTDVELDELKELVNDLWTIHDNYDDSPTYNDIPEE